MDDYYLRRANGAMNFLCGARSLAGLEMRKEVLFCGYATQAAERMGVFREPHEQCGFYADALDLLSGALWWADCDVREAKSRLVSFYRLLDQVVDENLVPAKRT